MNTFYPIGTKFSSHGHTWIAEAEKPFTSGGDLLERRQIWRSKKTWLILMCCYDVRRETIRWQVERYLTAPTRSKAAALAAKETIIQLERCLLRLAKYGTQFEMNAAHKAMTEREMANEE